MGCCCVAIAPRGIRTLVVYPSTRKYSCTVSCTVCCAQLMSNWIVLWRDFAAWEIYSERCWVRVVTSGRLYNSASRHTENCSISRPLPAAVYGCWHFPMQCYDEHIRVSFCAVHPVYRAETVALTRSVPECRQHHDDNECTSFGVGWPWYRPVLTMFADSPHLTE